MIYSRIFTLFFIVLFVSCNKKKEDPAPEPLPEQIKKPQLRADINGSTYTCNTCFSSYYSGGLHGINFAIESNGDRFIINISGKPATGTFNLLKFGNPSFNYQKNNVYYRGRGVLTISSIDTSAYGAINKCVATFSCNTDTTGSEHFVITNGEININN